jgi:hypothetical protein
VDLPLTLAHRDPDLFSSFSSPLLGIQEEYQVGDLIEPDRVKSWLALKLSQAGGGLSATLHIKQEAKQPCLGRNRKCRRADVKNSPTCCQRL